MFQDAQLPQPDAKRIEKSNLQSVAYFVAKTKLVLDCCLTFLCKDVKSMLEFVPRQCEMWLQIFVRSNIKMVLPFSS